MEFQLRNYLLWITQTSKIPLVALVALAVLLFLLANASWLLRRRQLARMGLSAPVLPHKIPLGIDAAYNFFSHLLGLDILEWTQDLLNHSGRTIEFHFLGTRLILTDDCDNVRAIMSTQFADFVKGKFVHAMFASVLGNSVFTTDGHSWIMNKNELRPHLAKLRPTDVELAERHVSLFLQHLDNGGSPIEVYDLTDRLQLDIITDVFFGCSTHSLRGHNIQFRAALAKLLAVSTYRVFAGWLTPLLSDRIIARQARKDFDKFMNEQVQRILSLDKAELKKRENTLVLAEALSLKSPDSQYIKDQLIAVLMAGKDPATLTIAWALYELARNPSIVKRLRDEIQARCGFETPPKMEELREMTLLRNIIRETLRMYHPLGFNIREAKIDTTLPRGGGPDGQAPVPILAGEQVIFSVIGLQRREDLIGKDANEWRPDRWNTWAPETWEYLPFNHGPRICLGRVFGIFQAEYTLARIFQQFSRVEPGDDRQQHIILEMNTKMTYPVMCRFHRI